MEQFSYRALPATSACAILCALSTNLFAARIEGRVRLSGRLLPDAVVSIEGVRTRVSPARTTYRLDHRDAGFSPPVMAILAGSEVRFENSDGMPCRIYSSSPSANFVLSPKRDKPAHFRFKKPGIVEVRCTQHLKAHAYIVIKNHPFFALTDRQGHFSLATVPPGTHALVVWHAGAEVHRRPIDVQTDLIRLNIEIASAPTEKK